jgi:hypothetical protein
VPTGTAPSRLLCAGNNNNTTIAAAGAGPGASVAQARP